MAFFHTQNGSLNLDAVRSIDYTASPDDAKTLRGVAVAELILVTGEIVHLFGKETLDRLKQATGWTDPGDGPFEYVFEESDAPETSAS